MWKKLLGPEHWLPLILKWRQGLGVFFLQSLPPVPMWPSATDAQCYIAICQLPTRIHGSQRGENYTGILWAENIEHGLLEICPGPRI